MKTEEQIKFSIFMMIEENERLKKDLRNKELSGIAKSLISKDISEREESIKALEWVFGSEKHTYNSFLINRFDNNVSHRPPKRSTIIFTNSRDKAEKCLWDNYKREDMSKVEIRKDYVYAEMLDGERVKWVKFTEGARGHRVSKVFLDRNVDIDFLNMIVLPICIYCSQDDVTII